MITLLIFFIFLPHLSFFGVSLPTDNQVFFLIPLSILLFNKNIKKINIPKFMFVPLILMSIGFCLGTLFINHYYLALKFNLSSFISYLLIPLIFGLGIYFSDRPRTIYKYLNFTIFILLIVILIQTFIPTLFDFFISRPPGDYDLTQRGNRSLLAEPSFVPSFSLLYYSNILLIGNFILKKRDFTNYFFITFAFITLILASKSGQILIVGLILFISFIICLIYYLIKLILNIISKKKLILNYFLINTTVLLSTSLGIFIPILLRLDYKGFRILFFVQKIFQDPYILFQDESLSIRLHALYMPIMTPIISPFNFIPNKSAYIVLSKINDYSLEAFSDLYKNYSYWFESLTKTDLIRLPATTYSILGNLSYDFSIFGLIFSLIFLFKITKSISYLIDKDESKNNDIKKIFFVSNFVLFSFINLSILCPPFWFLSGFIYGQELKRK